MPTKPTGFTRRQLRKIELNARVKRREREEAGYRDNRLELVVAYVYEVDGRQYTNDMIRIVGRYFTRASAETYASKYVPGTTRRCFYNPANPQQAVLTRGMRWDIPILFIGVGVGLPILFYS